MSVGNLSATENRPGHSLSLFGPKLAAAELWSQLFFLPGEFEKVSFSPVPQGIILSVWKGKNTHQLFSMENIFFFFLYKIIFFQGFLGHWNLSVCLFISDSWVTPSFVEQSLLFTQGLAASGMIFLRKTSLSPSLAELEALLGKACALTTIGEWGKHRDEVIVGSLPPSCRPPYYSHIRESSVSAPNAALIR